MSDNSISLDPPPGVEFDSLGQEIPSSKSKGQSDPSPQYTNPYQQQYPPSSEIYNDPYNPVYQVHPPQVPAYGQVPYIPQYNQGVPPSTGYIPPPQPMYAQGGYPAPEPQTYPVQQPETKPSKPIKQKKQPKKDPLVKPNIPTSATNPEPRVLLDEIRTSLYKSISSIEKLSPIFICFTQFWPIIVWFILFCIPTWSIYALLTFDFVDNIGITITALLALSLFGCFHLLNMIQILLASLDDSILFKENYQFYFSHIQFDMNWKRDLLWTSRYIKSNQFKSVRVHTVVDKYDALCDDTPKLYFVVDTYKHQQPLLDRQNTIPHSVWAHKDYFSPEPSVNTWDSEAGQTHIYPILLKSQQTISRAPSHDDLNNSYVNMAYTYSLSDDDQRWIDMISADIKQKHITEKYPYVNVQVRYVLDSTAQSIIDSDKSGFNETVNNSFHRHGTNHDKYTSVLLGAGSSLSQSKQLSSRERLSCKGYGKGDYELLLVNENKTLRTIYRIFGIILCLLSLQWLVTILVRLTTRYIWVVHVKELTLSQHVEMELK